MLQKGGNNSVLYMLRRRWVMALLITLFLAVLALLTMILLIPRGNTYFDAWYV